MKGLLTFGMFAVALSGCISNTSPGSLDSEDIVYETESAKDHVAVASCVQAILMEQNNHQQVGILLKPEQQTATVHGSVHTNQGNAYLWRIDFEERENTQATVRSGTNAWGYHLSPEKAAEALADCL